LDHIGLHLLCRRRRALTPSLTVVLTAMIFVGVPSALAQAVPAISEASTQLVTVPIEGSDRYATAVAASVKAFPTGSEHVLIATGANWPDALGGAALAGALDAPILLTRPDVLPAEVRAEIIRLGATKAIILGGTGAVSSTVFGQIDAITNVSVERIAGGDRYGTAILVAARTIEIAGGSYDGTAFIATGEHFPDALAASPLAASRQWPIYLAGPQVNARWLGQTMMAAGVERVVILGGFTVVPSTYDEAWGLHYPLRLAGADRYATAILLANYHPDDAEFTWDRVALATGENFPDALAGGVLQGTDNAVMLLTPSAVLHDGVRKVLTVNAASIFEVRFLGGTGAVSEPVRASVVEILQK